MSGMASPDPQAGPRSPAPTAIDSERPSIARVYDYVLGGTEHFEIDRRAAEGFLKVAPESALIPRDNRDFLRRAVRYLVAEAGVRRIIDIGSGLPTARNVHEIARDHADDVRVVYVDKDPGVLAHSRLLLGDDAATTVVTADLLEPESIFAHPAIRQVLNDDDKPLAILASGLLHHFSDEQDPVGIAQLVKAQLPTGGYLLLTNFLDDGEPRAKALERGFLQGGLGTGRFRTWVEQHQFFDGLEMVAPGLVYANDWRPDELTPADSPARTLFAAGIGRKVA